MRRPYTPVTKYPTQNERFVIYGIPEGKEQFNDILKIR